MLKEDEHIPKEEICIPKEDKHIPKKGVHMSIVDNLKLEIIKLNASALEAIKRKDYNRARDLQVEIKAKEAKLRQEIFERKEWKR